MGCPLIVIIDDFEFCKMEVSSMCHNEGAHEAKKSRPIVSDRALLSNFVFPG